MKKLGIFESLLLLAILVPRAVAVAAPAASGVPQMPHYRFENFTTANGLPNNHVFSVLVDGDRVWAGTENGLAVYENHVWKTYTTQDGLAHRAVLSLALDKRTGDVWAGTMARAEPHLGRAHRQLHAVELRVEQRCGLRRVRGGRKRVGGDGRRRLPA